MARKVIGAEMAEGQFSAEDLRDIFCLCEGVKSETYELLNAPPKGKKVSREQAERRQKVVDAVEGWQLFAEKSKSKVCSREILKIQGIYPHSLPGPHSQRIEIRVCFFHLRQDYSTRFFVTK